MKTHKVFVYGTLQSGNTQRGLDQFGSHAELIGPAHTTEGEFNMYDLGAFPGVVLQGTHNVVGQVWEVSNEAFDQLDMIEGYPGFYDRRPTETTLGLAWMYYLPDEYDAEFVPDNNGVVQWS
jgi:gamma-glutamylcyclotransferase (GGCT)/AIG2-like uncharacterized protein YtfP